jgi:hypothetical protein
MMKVVVGLFATAVVGLGGYTFYQYSSGNLSDSGQPCCSAAKVSSCCDASDVALTEESACCASLSRVSADKSSCCAPASPCCAPGSACCKGEAETSSNPKEVLAFMPREVK